MLSLYVMYLLNDVIKSVQNFFQDLTWHKKISQGFWPDPSVFWISPSEFWSLELDFYLVYCFGCSTKYSKNHQTPALWDLIEHILLCDPNIILLYRIYVLCYYNYLTLVNRGLIRLDLDQRARFLSNRPQIRWFRLPSRWISCEPNNS